MASIFKKEILVRPASTVSVEGAISFTKNWLNGFYDPNKPNVGYFADIFDPRGKYPRTIRVYHTSLVSMGMLAEDELVYNIQGDPNDPGFDDDYLDDTWGTADDYILSEDPLYISAASDIEYLKGLHNTETSEPENDTVDGINEETVRNWITEVISEGPALPGGSNETILALEQRIAELEGQVVELSDALV